MIRLFGLLWTRREFIEGLGLMMLPMHKAAHKPKPLPGEPGPSGLLLLLS